MCSLADLVKNINRQKQARDLNSCQVPGTSLIVPIRSPNHARETCEMKLEDRRAYKHVHTFKEVVVIQSGNLRGLAPHPLLPCLGSGPQDKQQPLILITALIFSPARSHYHNSRSAQYLAVVRFETLDVILRLRASGRK